MPFRFLYLVKSSMPTPVGRVDPSTVPSCFLDGDGLQLNAPGSPTALGVVSKGRRSEAALGIECHARQNLRPAGFARPGDLGHHIDTDRRHEPRRMVSTDRGIITRSIPTGFRQVTDLPR